MFDSLSALVQNFENRSGDPTALNYRYDATHTASGLYQITNQTWRQYFGQIANTLGLSANAYTSAASAPADVQNAVFGQIVAQRGLQDWTCPGCNAPLTNYLSANPGAASLPVFSGGSPAPAATSPASAAPAAGSPSMLNPASWFSALGNWFASVAGRGGLFLLGIIFIIGAIALLAIKSGIEIETRSA